MRTGIFVRLAAGAWLLAGLLLALSASRFVTVGVGLALEQAAAPRVTTSPLPVPTAERSPPGLGPAGLLALGSTRTYDPKTLAADVPPSGSADPAVPTVRLPLVVTLGPPRSELYVRGTRWGQTPFLGEVTCSAGEPIKIEVVPPKGMPIRQEVSCRPGATLRVGD